jgi:hypothetical protein
VSHSRHRTVNHRPLITLEAAGTFGFDSTKIRRGQNNDGGRETDEFGGQVPPPPAGNRTTARIQEDVLEEVEPGSLLEQEPERNGDIQMSEVSPVRDRVQMPISMPFAQYSTNNVVHVVSTLGVPRKEEPVEVEEGGGGGCCKCVVM